MTTARVSARWRALLEELAEELAAWAPVAAREADPWWVALAELPELAAGLVALEGADEPTAAQRRRVRRVLKYLVSPLDLVPEFVHGPRGLREDLYLVARLVADLAEEGCRPLLERHGLDPERPALRLARERGILDLDQEVREHLAWLLGDDPLVEDPEPTECAETWWEVAEAAPPAGDHTIVFAGPGAGKTRRLEQELLTLLEGGAPPETILVTTFTNKAADELRHRVRGRLEDAGAPADELLQRLTITTIHAFCYGLISEFHHHALFLKGTFAPLDAAGRLLFLHHWAGELGLWPIYKRWRARLQTDREACAHFAGPAGPFTFFEYVGGVYDFLSEEVVGDAAPELRHRYLQIVWGEPRDPVEAIVATYPRYWQLLQSRGYLDYAMVLAYTEGLLADPQVLDRVARRYRHILVDEYQDTNPIQDRILARIAARGARLFAVADDDQSIYAFRGADVHNAVAFPSRWPGARQERLVRNHRSRQALVRASRTLIEHNRVRVPKELVAARTGGEPPWVVEAPAEELPNHLARLLRGLRTGGWIHAWSEVAILFRSMNEEIVEPYRRALRAAGIPVHVHGDRAFFARDLVRGLVGIFELLCRPELSASLTRKRKFRRFFHALGIDDRAEMTRLVGHWHAGLHATPPRYTSLLELYYAIVDETGAIAHEEHLADLGRFSEILAEAEAQLRTVDLGRRLRNFLAYLAAAQRSLEGPTHRTEADGVALMTIHKSKGLEFPVVVVPHLVEGYLPAAWRTQPHVELWALLGGTPRTVDPIEEERRILYVALTRARELAIVTTTPQGRSRFLAELPHRAAPAPDALPPPPIREPHTAPKVPLHASHGELYSYHFCPRRYLLEHRFRFAQRAIPPLRAGKSLHRALEIFHRIQREGGRSLDATHYRQICERAFLAPPDPEQREQEFERLFAVFAAYARRWEDAHGWRVLAVEHPFHVVAGDGVLAGKIDLVRERDGRLEIVEFKYHANPTEPELPRRQLHHYALAFPEHEPRCVVHYLEEDREEEIAPPPLEEVRERLRATFAAIRSERFTPRPARLRCRICPVRFGCHVRDAGDVAVG